MKYRAFVLIVSTFVINSCAKPTQEVSIAFNLSYHGQSISCKNPVEALKLRDFRLYLHNIQLQNNQGQWQSIELSQDKQWQNANTVLLDFENGQQSCSNGNSVMNNRIIGMIAQADYQAIRFTLGVPFADNHQNPLLAHAPLNESSMHWHWQSGYKFVRAEFNYNDSPRRVHIGSLNCQGEIDNISHCESPNRATITIENFSPSDNQLDIRLDGLFDTTAQQDAPKVTCMGSDEKPWCDNALQWLGLTDKTQFAFHVAGE